MTILYSIAITVCNEKEEIKTLLNYLFKFINPQYEIIILFDEKNGNKATYETLQYYEKKNLITLQKAPFNHHFSDWKNLLTSFCKGKWILNLDADELPSFWLIKHLNKIVSIFFWADLIWIPRKNLVSGITKKDITKWNWKTSHKQWINWPDYQGRLYKNSPLLKWKNKVHESIHGAKKQIILPKIAGYFIRINHYKSIEKQRKQNNFYSQIETND